jgi:hypothetical protein
MWKSLAWRKARVKASAAGAADSIPNRKSRIYIRPSFEQVAPQNKVPLPNEHAAREAGHIKTTAN